MSDIPQKVQSEIDAADAAISAGEDELVNALVAAHDGAHGMLDTAESELSQSLDGSIGSVDNMLSDGERELGRVLDGMFRRADDTLSQGESELRSQGWQLPYAPGDVRYVLDSGVSSMLPVMVPELARMADGTHDVVPVCDTKIDPLCLPQSPTPPIPPPTPLPTPPPPPPGPCLGPGGLPWSDSPEGQAIIAQYQAAGTPLYPIPWQFGDITCQAWVPLMLGVDPHTETPVLVGPCISADGSPYGYSDLVDCALPTPPSPPPPQYPPPPYVPPPPPFVPPPPPPDVPPPPAPWPCPPQAPCCPDPVVNVTVNVPPIVVPQYPAPPQTPPPYTPPAPPDVPPTDTLPTPPGPPFVPPTHQTPPSPPPPIRFPHDELPEIDDRVYLFDWRYSDVCERIERGLSETPGVTPPVLSTEGTAESPTASLLSWLASEISGAADSAIESAIENATPYVVTAAIDSVMAAGFKLMNTVFGAAMISGHQHTDRLIKLGTSLGLSAWAERMTGAPIRYLNQDTLYAYQYESPQYIPAQGEIDDLYRRNLITKDTYICLTRAHGNLTTWRETLAYAAQSRPPAGELHRLYDRGVIDEGDWTRRMILHGYKDEVDRNLSYTVTEQYLDIRTAFEAWYREVINSEELDRIVRGTGWRDIRQVEAFAQTMQFLPPYSDIIRMMVHDVEDATVVSDYKLDTSFGDKFTGTLQKWAQWQRIPFNAALYMWRSHWQYPSPTQTYQFLHRLRQDRPERVAWEKENPRNPAESEYEYRNRGPLAFTVDDAKRLLAVNDMAPTFIGPEIAISYNPITRTDAIRAYEIGFYNEEQLKWNFIYNGYIDADADLLVGFEKEQKSRRIANATGVFTIRKVIKYYKSGSINRGKANDLLVPLMANPVDRQTILDRTEEEMSAEARSLRIQALKRQFMTGAVSIQTAADTLSDYGVDRFAVDTITSQWAYQLKARLKEPTAMMLCKWRNHQFITDAEYFERLQRLGYSFDDASRILSVCVSDMLEKQRKAALAAQEKAKKELEKALKSQYELEKASQKQLEKWLEKLQKQEEAVRKQIEKQHQSSGGSSNGQAH